MESRLTDDLVTLYTKDFDGSGGHRGVTVLEKLRRMKDKVVATKPLVESIQAEPGTEAFGVGNFHIAIRQANSVGVRACRQILEMLVERAFFDMKSLDYLKWAQCGEGDVPSIFSSDVISLGGFERSTALDLQKRLPAGLCNLEPNNNWKLS